MKARRRSLFRGLLVVLLFFAILPAAVGFEGMQHENLRHWAISCVQFPGCLWSMLKWAEVFLPFLMAIAGAGIVGLEYSSGTWKMILPRSPSRVTPLVAKWVVAVALCVVGVVIAELVTVAAGYAGARMLGVPFMSQGDGAYAVLFAKSQGFILLQAILMVSMSMLFTVLGRSLLAGVLLGVISEHVIRLLTLIPLGWLLPISNLDWLETQWMVKSRFVESEIVNVLRHPVSLASSIASVLVFSALFTGLMLLVFNRRDMVTE